MMHCFPSEPGSPPMLNNKSTSSYLATAFPYESECWSVWLTGGEMLDFGELVGGRALMLQCRDTVI